MIADPAFTAGSPWPTDGLLLGDLYKFSPPDTTHNWETDILALEAEIERFRSKPVKGLEMHTLEKGLCDGSSGTSVASSECGDDVCVDVECDIQDNLFGDDLASSIMGILDNSDVTESIILDSLDWTDSAAHICQSESDDMSHDSTESKRVHNRHRSPSPNCQRKHSPPTPNCNKWSQMSGNEQISTVEDLGRVISKELGLREQLEVIKMINPTACVSTSDKEFIIEIESINDEKLQKIREYIKLHSGSGSIPECSSEPNYLTQKKHSKKQKPLREDRRSQQKAAKQRQRKEQRQILKERRSGLFVKEEVLALCNPDPGEEENIEIE